MLAQICTNKLIKAKDKVLQLSDLLVNNTVTQQELFSFINDNKNPTKALCLSAFELATTKNPSLCDRQSFNLTIYLLLNDAPAIKRESTRIIGNVAWLFKDDLNQAVNNLLMNIHHEGAVVRWSVGFALNKIMQLNLTDINSRLFDVAQEIVNSNEKDSIKKFYKEVLN